MTIDEIYSDLNHLVNSFSARPGTNFKLQRSYMADCDAEVFAFPVPNGSKETNLTSVSVFWTILIARTIAT